MSDIPEKNHNAFVKVKVSRLAIASISLAFCGLIFVLLRTFGSDPRMQSTATFILEILLSIGTGMFVLAFIIGIVSLILIEKSGGMRTGKSFSVGAIVVSILGSLLMLCSFALIKVHLISFRLSCGTSLSGISKAMILYANDYDDEFPRAGGPGAKWGTSVKWDASGPYDAYVLNQNRSATISSSLFLLVKYAYADMTPKSFHCGSERVTEFEVQRDQDITQLWDFGPEPWKHVSYAYHNPYGGFPLTTSNEPGMAVIADRNPWIPSISWGATDFSKFNPNGKERAVKKGNNISHFFEGQNIAYLDTHVTFEKVSFCGVNNDNIYTSWNGSDIRKGTKPVFGSSPASRIDSLLVNDPVPINY